MTRFIRHISIALSLLFAASVSAQPRPDAQRLQGGADGSTTAGLSPKERGQLTHRFVVKWGNYVQRIYNVPVGTWAKRMVPNFVNADAGNLRNALKRDTFEGAIAELTGTGHRLSDDTVITRLASMDAGASRSKATVKTLGALTNDLVYTPLQPCRILDTRNTAAGAIAANATRSFVAITAGNFTGQGGSPTDCGTVGLAATAFAINLTAVTPSSAGYATAYPFGTTQPVAASVNYAAGAIVNNALIVQIPNPLTSFDFTVYTFASSHYVADIVGYFAPPQATALQCIVTTITSTTIAANTTLNVFNTACPAGYTATSPYCFINAAGVYSRGSGKNATAGTSDTFCSWQNTTASPQQVAGATTCCRVPGR